MPKLALIAHHLESYLRHADMPDYPAAVNGLQLENSGSVRKIAAAVDACEAVIAEAVRRKASLLLVHHGLMWDQHIRTFTGARYRKLKTAIAGDLAIFSSHLPLDAHPVVGNAAQLAQALKLRNVKPFFPFRGCPIGVRGEIAATTAESLQLQLRAACESEVRVCAAGPARIRKIGIVTGGAGSEIGDAARTGIDAFVTGEGPHWSYTAAEELGIHLFYAGHYATETFGVKALGAQLSRKFRIPWEFIDHPTGL
ncbi:MAG: Nif3-like dinuclear metal center hexameric protein [Chthoniobacteraceae bacterium]